MGHMPDLKEFKGIGGRYTVACAFGGVVEFDDKSLIIALNVAGHSGKKLIQTIGAEGSKAADFFRRFVSTVRKEDGEGLTDFELEVFRATVGHSFTMEERDAYADRWTDDDALFMDLPND